MLSVIASIWSVTNGLVFTFFILLPALTTALVVVSIVSGKGEKDTDAQLRGRWGRGRRPADD